MSVSDEQWRQDFEAVFLGGLRLAREVLSSSEPMSVAWVLSTSAVEPVTGLPTSNGLRPGLAMVIKDLADEVAPRGSRINGLLPGRISTDRIAELDRNRGPEATARTLAGIPMGRYGEPEEFARVAAFVLSPAASYVTGTLIRIDGGLTRQP
jgi:3-oxoacyl-[acyl-carrier protein] reductase